MNRIKPFLLLLLVFLLAGCREEKTEYFGTTRPLHPPDVAWINNGPEPEFIDPGRCSDSAGGEIIRNIFAGLTEPHPQNIQPRPDIASHWEISPNGKEYTFYLRKSGWSDGTPLTAHDFRWSWLRVLDPHLASKYVANMFIFANGEARTRGAIYVYGIPSDVTTDQILELCRQAVRSNETKNQDNAEQVIESVRPAEWPHRGFMVFLGGDLQSRDKYRSLITKQIKERFPGSTARRATDNDVGISVIDDYTLHVRLENAIPYFLDFLSFYTFMPVPRHVIERLEAQGIDPSRWTREEYIVSNGAYRMSEWRFRQYMVFEPNEHYWNRQHPDLFRIQKIKLFAVESYNTCMNLYFAGELDYPGPNTSIPSEFMDHLRQYKDFHFDPYLSVYFFWLNTKAPPLDNVHFRRALSLAIDREKIVKYVTRGGQQPTASLVPDGLAGYQSPDIPLFDLDLAKSELAKAGYPGGKGVPPVTLIYNTAESHKQIAVAIQQMWKDHLNIDVQIENQEWNVYLSRLNQRDFQIARLGWNGDYPDPYTYLELLTSTCGNNRSQWSNSEYDRLLKEANATLDREKRLQIMQQAERLALAEQPLIPLYVYTRSIMIKPYLQGIWGNYQDLHPWKFLWIDERWYNGIPDDDEPPNPPDVWTDSRQPVGVH